MHAVDFQLVMPRRWTIWSLRATLFRVRRRFDEENCSLARALEVLGDWWTLLVIREAFVGTRRFADFEANLGISKNVLTSRLDHLVEHGVMTRVDAGVHGTRYEYELTAMGKDLLVVVTALRQWGDRWIFGEGKEPLLVVDRRTGAPIPRLTVRGDDGERLRGSELELRPGPGATAGTRARFARDRK
jgi:DNA-binding HxlR family transcriptional regulator